MTAHSCRQLRSNHVLAVSVTASTDMTLAAAPTGALGPVRSASTTGAIPRAGGAG
jgi:hypothetical protein